jgi:hypothetical protein
MKMKKLAFMCLAALLGGCVPFLSLHPLFTEEDIVFEAKLLGTWVDDSDPPEFTWEFARLDPTAAENLEEQFEDQVKKFYRLNLSDKEGHKGSLVACLVKLKDRLFLDVFPDKPPSGETDPEEAKLMYNAFFFISAHTFLRVDSIGEELALRLTVEGRFQELLEADPDAVEFTRIDDRSILTASTKELQAFVVKYAGDERLFPGEMNLVRKTGGDPAVE